MLKIILAASLTLLTAGSALASSDDAWAAFAMEVEEGCVAGAAGVLTDPTVVVDPFGSEHFGLALLTSDNADGSQSSVICVFDKQTKAVELGGELPVADQS